MGTATVGAATGFEVSRSTAAPGRNMDTATVGAATGFEAASAFWTVSWRALTN